MKNFRNDSKRPNHVWCSRKTNSRRGAVLPIMVAGMVVLLVMTAFAVDIAYMQLAQTQLRAASDAAAKAGVYAISNSQSVSTAQAAAISMAAANQVAGKPLVITSGDMQFGQSISQTDGSWAFTAGVTPYSAMKLTPSLSASNANGAVNLFFGNLLGTRTFSTSTTSIASLYEQEVAIVLDRSHSMCFDLSGTLWSYPAPYYSDWVQGIEHKPQPGSRWASLVPAVQSFITVLQSAPAPPRCAVVTWASTIGTNTTEYQLTGQTSPAVTVDLQLTSDLTQVIPAVNVHSNNVMIGGTNMASGIDQGVQILTASNVKPYAEKVMVLMTDGQWNEGNDPVQSATTAAGLGVKIHTVGFLPSGQSDAIQQVAAVTGGQYYYASDAASLQAAFKAIALSLPVVLTK